MANRRRRPRWPAREPRVRSSSLSTWPGSALLLLVRLGVADLRRPLLARPLVTQSLVGLRLLHGRSGLLPTGHECTSGAIQSMIVPLYDYSARAGGPWWSPR